MDVIHRKRGTRRNSITMIGRLMDLAALGSSFANAALLQRFLVGLISVIALTILCAMMASLVLACCFYGFCMVLIHYGLTPEVALIVTVVLAALTTALLAASIMWKMRQLRVMSTQSLPNSIYPHVQSVVTAFVAGFKKHMPTAATPEK